MKRSSSIYVPEPDCPNLFVCGLCFGSIKSADCQTECSGRDFLAGHAWPNFGSGTPLTLRRTRKSLPARGSRAASDPIPPQGRCGNEQRLKVVISKGYHGRIGGRQVKPEDFTPIGINSDHSSPSIESRPVVSLFIQRRAIRAFRTSVGLKK